MAWMSLTLRPGVDTEVTTSTNEAGISDSSFIRWKQGFPEKRGGWTKLVNSQFASPIRELHAWLDLNGNSKFGVGTQTVSPNGGLFVVANGAVKDITAQSETVSVAVSISTTNGSTDVIVTDTGRNVAVYDAIVFNVPIAVGGIVLDGMYQATSGGAPDTYHITATSAATSTVVNGGAVPLFTTISGSSTVKITLAAHGKIAGQLFAATVSTTVGGVTIFGLYEISSIVDANNFNIAATTSATASTSGFMNGGQASYTYYRVAGPPTSGSGFGIGGFGGGGFGTGTTPTATTAALVETQDYWLDNWGQILISCPTGGTIFSWSPNGGYANSGPIVGAPLANKGMFIAMPSQQIMAWGSTYNKISDPLQIRWCDAFDFAVWEPLVVNQAGGYHLPTGSEIVRGMQVMQNTIWFTDVDAYIGTYVGQPFVWDFNRIAGNCGLIAPKAAAILANAVFWMSQKQFFIFDGGGVSAIPCRVWDAVFQNINMTFSDNIRCGTNAQFNEVLWYYPSAASIDGENDSYVCFNTQSREWDIGALPRTAWSDQSIFGPPIGSGADGYLYQHETSYDADGEPITANFETGYFDIGEGDYLTFVDYMIPDFKFGTYAGSQAAQVQITFTTTDYLGGPQSTWGPFTMDSTTEFIEPRFRARFVKMLIGSSDTGSFWRLGKIRMRHQADGRR